MCQGGKIKSERLKLGSTTKFKFQQLAINQLPAQSIINSPKFKIQSIELHKIHYHK